MPSIYVMRHGLAESGAGMDDEQRRLTQEGHRTVGAIGGALRRHGVRVDGLVCSPLVRATQTAEDLGATLAPDVDVQVCPVLAPGYPAAQVVEWLAQRCGKAQGVVLVGHLPDLGALTGYLLHGEGTSGNFTFQPGGMARVDMQGALRGGVGVLRWLLLPEQLMALPSSA